MDPQDLGEPMDFQDDRVGKGHPAKMAPLHKGLRDLEVIAANQERPVRLDHKDRVADKVYEVKTAVVTTALNLAHLRDI
uniref:IS5/IS1182 family transposase n=1 Tax=Ascaris lumbricoides TaxID=6252 RepID=A0A0M3IER1_ASCLU